MKQAAIIGLGTVGNALRTTLEMQGQSVVGFDRDHQFPWAPVVESEIVFVCVDTPSSENGRIDASNVHNVLTRLEESGYTGLVVLRSTLPIGFGEDCTNRYSLRLVYMPEFLRQRSALEWSLNPDRIVIGGDAKACAEADQWFSWTDAPRVLCDWTQAEIGKLAHNARIAVMVSFTNEIEEICQQFDVNPMQVMKVVSTDRRLATDDHLRPGMGPYAGKCVPKDTTELLAATGSKSVIEAARTLRERLSQKVVSR